MVNPLTRGTRGTPGTWDTCQHCVNDSRVQLGVSICRQSHMVNDQVG